MGLLSWGFKKKNNNERQSRHFPGKWSEVQTNPKRPSLLAWVYDLVGMVDFTAWPEQKLVGGFNPIPLKTMLVKMGISFPKFSGWKIQKIFELPPPRKCLERNRWLRTRDSITLGHGSGGFFRKVLSPFRELAWKPEIRDVLLHSYPVWNFLHIWL